MLQRILYYLLILYTFARIIEEREVNFTGFHLSRYRVDNDWNKVEKMLDGEPIRVLRLDNILICEQALKRILEYKTTIDSLNELRLSRIDFNQVIIKTIWQTKVIPRLKVIIFDSCGLEDSDMVIMANITLPKLQQFSLRGNYLTIHGFKYLPTIHMPNLKSLNLYGNSLIANESINSLLQLNLSVLTQINIGYTSISSNNAYRIISSLNQQSLTTLNISQNNFNEQFYQNLSNFSFSALKILAIDDLLMDGTTVKYLQPMRFPQLETLCIGGNWLFVDNLYSFMHKNNYPKLINLVIQDSLFEDKFLQYLAQQFTDTRFQTLVLIGNGISAQGFKHLLNMNTEKLKKLAISHGMVQPFLIEKLFRTKQLNNLEQLDFFNLLNTGPIFSIMAQIIWPNLKILKLKKINQINPLKLKQINRIIFPNLQTFIFDACELTTEEFRQLIYFLTKTCYHELKIQVVYQQYYEVVLDIVDGQYKGVSNKIQVIMKKLQGQFTKIVQNRIFTATLVPQGKAIVKDTLFSHVLQDIFAANYINWQQDFDEAKAIQQKIFTNLNFLELEKVVDYKNLTIIRHFVQEFQKKGQKCMIFSIEAIWIYQMTVQGYEMLKQCEFPYLRIMIMATNETFEVNWTDFKLFHQNLTQVNRMVLQLNKFPKQIIIDMFKSQKFDSLKELFLYKDSLDEQSLREIFEDNPNLKRLKKLKIMQMKPNQNLTFLVDFDLKLKELIFGYGFIGKNLIQLVEMNWEFVQVFYMISAGISNQDFLKFSKQIKSKNLAFPRLKSMRFSSNYIQTQGTNKFLEINFPMLELYDIAFNRDPNMMNAILGSPNARRMKQFIIYRNEQDSVDPNLNPNNSRSLQSLTIQAGNLHPSDYKAFSKLDFRSVKYVAFLFHRFQCESFIDLAKIVANTKILYLIFDLDDQNIDSQCFIPENVSYKYSFLTNLRISIHAKQTSNLRKFSTLLLKGNKLIKELNLMGVYPQPEVFKKFILNTNLQYLEVLILDSNDITDEMIKELFRRELKSLAVLSLTQNPRLTSEGISFMRGKTYPFLEDILLKSTRIDNRGLEILASCHFPRLKFLSLNNIQITGKGIQYLSKLKAPLLNTIDLSNNLLSLSDLKKLNTSSFPYLKNITIFPTLYQYQFNELNIIYNQGRPKRRKIQILPNATYLYQSEEDL